MAFLYEFHENSHIPINVNEKTFESVAADFLAYFGCDIFYTPEIPVNINDLANRIFKGSIFNKRISSSLKPTAVLTFFDGEVDVYEDDSINCVACSIGSDTLLINSEIASTGDKNILIAQGCLHWYLHQLYFDEARKVDPYSSIGLNYSPRFDLLDDFEKVGINEANNMVAQALGVALCVLMPEKIIKKRAEGLFALYEKELSSISRKKVLREIAAKLASLFNVSTIAVFYRLKSIGLLSPQDILFAMYKPNASLLGKQAETPPKFIKSSTSPFTRNISINDAFVEFQENESFYNLMQTHNFIYVNGHFVINNHKYIERDETGKPFLTNYAIANPSECSLLFTYRIQVDDDSGVLPQYSELTGDIQKVLTNARYMENSGFSYTKLPHYVPNKSNERVLSDAEVKIALENASAEFERFCNEYVSMAISPDFWSRVEYIKKIKNISDNKFLKLTHLDDKTISRTGGNIPKGKKSPKELKGISMRVAMAVCVGLNLDVKQAEELLSLAKLALNNERECIAYRFILIAFKDCGIDERNDFLKKNGIEPLGVK